MTAVINERRMAELRMAESRMAGLSVSGWQAVAPPTCHRVGRWGKGARSTVRETLLRSFPDPGPHRVPPTIRAVRLSAPTLFRRWRYPALLRIPQPPARRHAARPARASPDAPGVCPLPARSLPEHGSRTPPKQFGVRTRTATTVAERSHSRWPRAGWLHPAPTRTPLHSDPYSNPFSCGPGATERSTGLLPESADRAPSPWWSTRTKTTNRATASG